MNGDGERLRINQNGEVGSNSNNNSDILDEDMEEFIRNLSAEGGLSPLDNPRQGSSSSRSRSRYTDGGGDILSPNTINAVVKDELDALEELERVLGLDEVKVSGNITRASIDSSVNTASHNCANSNVNANANNRNNSNNSSNSSNADADADADGTWTESDLSNKQSASGAASISLDDFDDIVEGSAISASAIVNSSLIATGSGEKSKDCQVEESFAQDFNDIEKYFESLESPSKQSSDS